MGKQGSVMRAERAVEVNPTSTISEVTVGRLGFGPSFSTANFFQSTLCVSQTDVSGVYVHFCHLRLAGFLFSPRENEVLFAPGQALINTVCWF